MSFYLCHTCRTEVKVQKIEESNKYRIDKWLYCKSCFDEKSDFYYCICGRSLWMITKEGRVYCYFCKRQKENESKEREQ